MNSAPSSAAGNAPLPLADIALPESVAWWPLAPGYWIVLALLALLGLIIAMVLQQRARNRYRQQLIHALDAVAKPVNLEPSASHDLGALTRETLLILKRAAKHLGAGASVLSASNPQFLVWLEAASPSSSLLLDDATRALICEGAYRPTPTGDAESLLNFARHWLKHHQSRQAIRGLSVPTKQGGAR